jgi:mono/diheme cytochrome c family protein
MHYDSAPEPSTVPVLKAGTDPAVIKRGEQLFGENCASCHGPSGRGDGAGASGLFPRPANLAMVEHSAPRLTHILWNGIPGSTMPRWNRLSTADLEAVEAYVRTVEANGQGGACANSSGIEQGRDLYCQNCTGCHGSEGSGNGPAAAALAPTPTNFHEERPTRAHSLKVRK